MTKEQLTPIAASVGLTYAELMAFISVESGGQGFAKDTRKLVIQLEPHWFSRFLTKYKVPHSLTYKSNSAGRRVYTLTANGITFDNGVEGQEGEWEAFNKAFAIHPDAAMQSTSVGLMQIMGFHWKRLGYSSVGSMWDDAKKGEERQIYQGGKFIQTDARLFRAIKRRQWALVAEIYNGEGYKINRYDERLEQTFARYSR